MKYRNGEEEEEQKWKKIWWIWRIHCFFIGL